MKLSGNTVLITGGATGIGFAFAEAFLNAGNEVIILSRRKEKLEAAQSKYPSLHVKECDISDGSSRDSIVSWAIGNFMGLNVIINNAGIQKDVDLRRGLSDLVNGESEIRINLEAPIYLTALLIPYLMNKEDAVIINVTSALGIVPVARTPVYCAAKAGMHIFTKCLRQQLLQTGIKVFEVLPPAVDTGPNMREAGQNAAEPGQPNITTLSASDYIASVMQSLQNDEQEIMSSDLKNASGKELQRTFESMNVTWNPAAGISQPGPGAAPYQ